MSTRLIAGAMSGTSADGVDVAIVRIEGRGLGMSASFVRHHHRPYDPQLRARIMRMREAGSAELRELVELTRQVSLTYAAAINEALAIEGLRAQELAAVAAHGQTLFHDPPLTTQALDPSLLAAEVGCAMVSDFRRADLAVGGQGAPLVPFADYILFRHPTKNRVLLNIGGIANLTWLPAGASTDQVIAFDTGPGNCISDHLCQTRDPAGPPYDIGGDRATAGRVDPELAQRVLSHSYFQQPPPKSTDSPAMIRIFEDALAVPGKVRSLEDLLATACYVTSIGIHRAVMNVLSGVADEAIVSGGGTRNEAIMSGLREISNDLLTTDALGVPSQAKEAVAFALLGAATLAGEPSNVPSATGARRAVVLGSITPKPQD